MHKWMMSVYYCICTRMILNICYQNRVSKSSQRSNKKTLEILIFSSEG